MKYLVKTPWIFRKFWPSFIWQINTDKKIIYLTFDDGPHPVATPFVLDQLKNFEAKATFFCVGKNVKDHPEIFSRVLEEGHAIGNHTQHHLNGWKTKDDIYLKDVAEASNYIDSDMFRPPYGRIGKFQAMNLSHAMRVTNARIIMWSVLSGDFDHLISKERCLQNVVLHARPGSIIVFHDSEKAFPLMEYALPRTLEFFKKKGYSFDKL
jgi:peptidoglycan-N-acetylglucosamine deacetylase